MGTRVRNNETGNGVNNNNNNNVENLKYHNPSGIDPNATSRMLWSHLIDGMWLVLMVIVACVVALYVFQEATCRPDYQTKAHIQSTIQKITEWMISATSTYEQIPWLAWKHMVQADTLLQHIRCQYTDQLISQYAQLDVAQLMHDLQETQLTVQKKIAQLAPQLVSHHKYAFVSGLGQ